LVSERIWTRVSGRLSLPRNGVLSLPKKKNPVPDHLIRRNEATEYIRKQGSQAWKNRENCHQGSLNEVVMFKYKTIFSGELKAREMKNQITEVKFKCMILNGFSKTGSDFYKTV
jgi:hypothetical protein